MFKNVASQKVALFAFDITTGAPKTGDSANITPYVAKDYSTVTVLGTTTATEMDSTNAKGWYSFVLTQGETNGDALLFTAKSSTSNIVLVGLLLFTTPANFSTMSVDSNGRVDVIKINGTSQTARDIGANVLLSAGTGTGQLDFTSGVVKANATQWLGGTIPAVNVTGVPLVDLKYILGTISPATAGSVRADAVTGAVGSVTGAVGSVTGNIGGNVVGSVASVTARVTANTDQVNGVAGAAANLAKTTNAIVRGTVGTSSSTTSITTSAITTPGSAGASGQFIGRTMLFDSDTTTTNLQGQATNITANTTGSTPTFTVTALTTAPVSGDTFSIV